MNSGWPARRSISAGSRSATRDWIHQTLPSGSRTRPTRSPQNISVMSVTEEHAHFERAPVDGVAVGDVQAEERRSVGPLRLRVERHDHGIADPDLGMPDRPVVVLDARNLDRPEGLLHEVEEHDACRAR